MDVFLHMAETFAIAFVSLVYSDYPANLCSDPPCCLCWQPFAPFAFQWRRRNER